MGALVSIFAAVAEVAAATGFTAEALLTGEAAVSLTSQIASLVAQGFTYSEALAGVGVSAEALAYTTALAEAAEVGGSVWTTLATSAYSLGASGAAGLAAGIQGGIATAAAGLVPTTSAGSSKQTSMALQRYNPELWLFPEAQWIYNAYHYFDPNSWLPSLIEQISDRFWSSLLQAGQRQLTSEASAIALRTSNRLWYSLVESISNAVWFVRNSYYALDHYYRVIPPRFGNVRLRTFLEGRREDRFVNPPTFVAERTEQGRVPERVAPAREGEGGESHSWFQGEFSDYLEKFRKLFTREQQESGERVIKIAPPGGAEQMTTPDWLVPLVLGLLGDLTPTFEADIKRYGSKRKRKDSSPGAEIGAKRRYRGARPKVRRGRYNNRRGLFKS